MRPNSNIIKLKNLLNIILLCCVLLPASLMAYDKVHAIVPWQIKQTPASGTATLNCALKRNDCSPLQFQSKTLTLNGAPPYSGKEEFIFNGKGADDKSNVVCVISTQNKLAGAALLLTGEKGNCGWNTQQIKFKSGLENSLKDNLIKDDLSLSIQYPFEITYFNASKNNYSPRDEVILNMAWKNASSAKLYQVSESSRRLIKKFNPALEKIKINLGKFPIGNYRFMLSINGLLNKQSQKQKIIQVIIKDNALVLRVDQLNIGRKLNNHTLPTKTILSIENPYSPYMEKIIKPVKDVPHVFDPKKPLKDNKLLLKLNSLVINSMPIEKGGTNSNPTEVKPIVGDNSQYVNAKLSEQISTQTTLSEKIIAKKLILRINTLRIK